jgi:uncharacterized protein (TIGR02246 family)
MKTASIYLVFTVILSFAASAVHAQTNPEANKKAIKEVLQNYAKALNSGNAKYAASLYSEDCVLMPPDGPTILGKEKVAESYKELFKSVSIELSFQIDEVVIRNDLGYARTTSKGSIKLLKDNKTIPEGNRELFIFKKEKGSWKISRYLFNLNK